jgi:hypothetical protein
MWEKPLNDGGCSITSYHIFLREVGDATWDEVDPGIVNYQPLLSEYDIDMSAKTVGHLYNIKMTVDNKVGDTTSDSIVFLLADVPDQPEPPTRVSDGHTLVIVMAPPASDGGSQITSYQLAIMLPGADEWSVVLGETSNSLVLEYTLTTDDLQPS